MLIVLPDSINGLKNVERDLASLTIAEITRNTEITHVELDLPKFEISYLTDPKNILRRVRS